MYRLFVCSLVIIAIVLNGCQNNSNTTSNSSNNPFFDLEAFFEAEAAFLNEKGMQLHKVIEHNKQQEEQTTAVADWNNELRLFKESNINKPSWRDKYQLDSTDMGNGLTLLQYKALDDALVTRMIDIKKANNAIHSIVIVNSNNNVIYESQQYLTYIPRKSYSIKQTQEVTLFEKDEYNIEAKYIHP